MSAITIAQFKNAVWTWISSQMPVSVPASQVVWMEQGTPRPKLPYVGLKIIAGPRSYGDDDMRQKTPGIYTIEGQRAATISVHIFGVEAEEIAATIVSAMSKPSALESLAAKNIALLTNTDPQNISTPLETKFENRIQLDIVFGCVMGTEDAVGFIERTSILDRNSGDRDDIGPT